MSFLLGSDGKISVLRVSLLAIAVGGLFIIGAIISIQIDVTSRRAPLDIEVYPGATPWGEQSRGRSQRSLYFQIPDTEPEVVVEYYQQKLNEFYGTTPENERGKPLSQQIPNAECVRLPRQGNFSDYEPGNGLPAYQYTCIFDRSYSDILQVTEVIIQPGVRNDSDPNAPNTEGMTVVEYRQQWEP